MRRAQIKLAQVSLYQVGLVLPPPIFENSTFATLLINKSLHSKGVNCWEVLDKNKFSFSDNCHCLCGSKWNRSCVVTLFGIDVGYNYCVHLAILNEVSNQLKEKEYLKWALRTIHTCAPFPFNDFATNLVILKTY